MYKYEIQYQYATYSGIETVFADDHETAIAQMWRSLKKYMTLPMAYQSEKILSCEEYDGD